MNIKPADDVLKRPLCTWLTEADHERFASIAKANGVTTAAYLRSIVVDVIAEETAAAVGQRLLGSSDMLMALKAVEEWWLREGMAGKVGAPYAIFAVRAAIAKSENPVSR